MVAERERDVTRWKERRKEKILCVEYEKRKWKKEGAYIQVKSNKKIVYKSWKKQERKKKRERER